MIETNEELDNLTEHKNIIHFIEVRTLRWLGHVERVPEEKYVKKIYKWN
jgi:Holliday junction resolvase-like predicted endonuclease